MKYAYITISNDEISYEKKEISMDEGLKIFTNALVDLANSSPSYDQYKIFLLNMKDGEYSFDNVKKDKYNANINELIISIEKCLCDK